MPDRQELEQRVLVMPVAACTARRHPISKQAGLRHCLVCTLLWVIGGDEAVRESRRDEIRELEWLFKGGKAIGS